MNLFHQHPATQQLQRQQGRARINRFLNGFRSPRRMVLSFLGLVLGLLWIGQAVAGMLFRGPADPQRVLCWITMGLTAFATWNVIKIIFKKPVEPFEWSNAEKEWLLSAPISRGQLVRFRVAGISVAALFKAVLFSLVMIPDLHFVAFGFVGLYLALMLTELIRMIMEVVMSRISPVLRTRIRYFVGSVLALALSAIAVWYFQNWQVGKFDDPFTIGFLKCLLSGVLDFANSSFGQVFSAPFSMLASAMLASTVSWTVATKLFVGLAAVIGLFRLLEWTDLKMLSYSQRSDRSKWPNALAKSQSLKPSESQLDARFETNVMSRLGRVGGLVWRQWLGVKHYRGTVAFALALPLAFAITPAFGNESGWQMVEKILLLISCYSFLLLPTALKFDFRRDLDRINFLKALPVSPFKVVCGQLLVPVVVTTCFQIVTLLLAMIVNPFHPGLLLVSMAILIPTNVFIYGLENLLFLWYPYRVTEEGFHIFVRTILSFTAKGLLMGVGLALCFGCLIGCILVCRSLQFTHPETISLVLFTLIFGAVMTSIGSLVIYLLTKAFKELDPSHDLATVRN